MCGTWKDWRKHLGLVVVLVFVFRKTASSYLMECITERISICSRSYPSERNKRIGFQILQNPGQAGLAKIEHIVCLVFLECSVQTILFCSVVWNLGSVFLFFETSRIAP